MLGDVHSLFHHIGVHDKLFLLELGKRILSSATSAGLTRNRTHHFGCDLFDIERVEGCVS